MNLLIFSIRDDFLFEDENKNLYFLRRDVLDKITENLNLDYFATVISDGIFKEIYYDRSSNSAIIFKYRPKTFTLELEDFSISFYSFLMNEEVEVYEDFMHYLLNIRRLLQPYIRNEKIIQLAKSVVKEFVEKQKYVV